MTIKKELGRYLFPVLRKKYKTVRHLKKYPPKDTRETFLIGLRGFTLYDPQVSFKSVH